MRINAPVQPESPSDIARAERGPRGQDALSALWPLVVLIPISAWAYMLFVPEKPLPVNIGNGSYENACCAALTLWNGQAQSGDVVFKYAIMPGKEGPLVLIDKRNVVVDGGRLHLVDSRAGQFLPMARGEPPAWVEVDGQRFVRTK